MATKMNSITDKHFWECKRHNCNCGGYAFNIEDWYFPYSNEEDEDEEPEAVRENKVKELLDEGYDKWDIYNILLNDDRRYMLNDFGKDLIAINSLDEAKPEDTVIAYRICLEFDDDECPEYIEEMDFHYKVRLNGHWMEKNGGCDVHPCALDADKTWDYKDNIYYDSPIIYFIRRPY